MTGENDYENQEVLKVIRQFSEDEDIDFDYCKLYELLEVYLL